MYVMLPSWFIAWYLCPHDLYVVKDTYVHIITTFRYIEALLNYIALNFCM